MPARDGGPLPLPPPGREVNRRAERIRDEILFVARNNNSDGVRGKRGVGNLFTRSPGIEMSPSVPFYDRRRVNGFEFLRPNTTDDDDDVRYRHARRTS